jgi:uncharacterized membrane protein YgcG
LARKLEFAKQAIPKRLMLSLFLVICSFFPLGFPKKLKQKPERIHIVHDYDQLRIAGNKVEVGIEVVLKDGSVMRTRNLGGKLRLRRFKFETERARYFNGSVKISDGFYSGSISINAYPKKFQEVQDRLLLNLHQERDIWVAQEPKGPAAPGEKYRVAMKAIFDSGHERLIGTREVPYDRYQIRMFGGWFKKGTATINDDFEQIVNHQTVLQVTPLATPKTSFEVSYYLDYKKHYRFNSSGSDGFSGFSGADGSSGSFGGDGASGTDGGDGRHGDHAPNVFVDLWTYYDTLLRQEMLVAQVEGFWKTKKYLINPHGGGLSVTTQGGDGGSGGNGGNGGHGGNGRDGMVRIEKEKINDSTFVEKRVVGPAEDGGDGGDGGYGGHGGDGGNGGDIFCYHSEGAVKYLQIIDLKSAGGRGGFGGSGGSAGSGGRGGDGEPDGNNGSSGCSGLSGANGRSGRDGNVVYQLIKESEYHSN